MSFNRNRHKQHRQRQRLHYCPLAQVCLTLSNLATFWGSNASRRPGHWLQPETHTCVQMKICMHCASAPCHCATRVCARTLPHYHSTLAHTHTQAHKHTGEAPSGRWHRATPSGQGWGIRKGSGPLTGSSKTYRILIQSGSCFDHGQSKGIRYFVNT